MDFKHQLWLIRHAEAVAQVPSRRDFDRHLSDNGLAEAAALGALFYRKELKPDTIVASTAVRTQMTAKILAEAVGFDTAAIDSVSELYDATEADLLFSLKQLPESAHTVFVVGHNPSMMSIASQLAEDFVSLPTCGVACFEVNDTWAALSASTTVWQENIFTPNL